MKYVFQFTCYDLNGLTEGPYTFLFKVWDPDPLNAYYRAIQHAAEYCSNYNAVITEITKIKEAVL